MISVVDKMTLEQVFFDFLHLSATNNHSANASCSLIRSSMCAVALTRQNIITSTIFKNGASFLTCCLAVYKVRKLVLVCDNDSNSNWSEVTPVLNRNPTEATGTRELDISTTYKCRQVYVSADLPQEKSPCYS
jgi:hypothetical protein